MKDIPGQSAYARAVAKMHLVSTGVPYDDLGRPVVGVVNSWNEVVPGHVPLREVAQDVKDGVRAAGGLPLEFNTIALCDGIAQGHRGMRYALPSRDLIADSVEAMVEGHGLFDGLVFVTACDKITPGMLLAAVRLNLPALLVTGGPVNTQVSAAHKGELRRRLREGRVDERGFVLESLDFYGPGICPYLGTANTMLMASEALGLMLPGTATIPCGTAQRRLASRQAGQQAVALVRQNRRPSDFLTPEAFRNAVRVVLAVGGSLNAALHLPGIAAEAGVTLDWDDFDRLSREVPLLSALTPNGLQTVPDFHRAGGVPGLLKRLSPLLDLAAPTVSGETVGEVAARAEVTDPAVIAPLSAPVRPEGGLAVLKGNLAPGGALVKQSGVAGELRVFTGPARVFDSEEECVAALERDEIHEGEVLVIRYEGPRGGPGMREMHRVTELTGGFKRLAIVTDGRFSGASAGLAVGYLRPEAYDGGPLALVRDGDRIAIDLPRRQLHLDVADDVLAERRARWKPVEKPASRLLRKWKTGQ